MGDSRSAMQQFARRPEPGQPDNTPKPVLGSDSVNQLLDQLTELAKQVAVVRAEVASVKAENQQLRQQIAGLSPSPNAFAPEPIVAPEPTQAEAPVLEPTPEAPIANRLEPAPHSQEKIDEEFLVDLVRAQGVKETTVTAKPDVIDTVLLIEEAQGSTEPMSDFDIQRMLAEAALGAFDAAKPTSERVEESPVAPHEPVATEEPLDVPVLTLVEDEPEEDPHIRVAFSFDLDKALVAKVPANLAIAALAVPHRMEGNKLVCKAAQPYDYPSLDIIADAVAFEVVPEPAEIEQVLAALRRAYGDENRDMEKDAVWGVSANEPKRRRGLFRRSA